MRFSWMALLGALVAAPLAAQDASVEEAIDALNAKYEEAWNQGDAAAIASLHAEDGDQVDFMGNTFKGRAAMQENLVQTLANYPGTSLDIERTSVHVVTPEIVVYDGTWEVTGGKPEEGAPTKGLYTTILTKEGEGWTIVSLRTKIPPSAPTN